MNQIAKHSPLLTTLITLLAIFLSACGPTATPAPTQDVNAVFTQAAATIVSEITQTAAAMPTATLVPPTATPEPSATSTIAQVAEVTPTQAPANAAASTATPIPVDPNAAFGCYNATFMAHVTQLYAPSFNPGDRFTKPWRV
jgi:hypothetical protein